MLRIKICLICQERRSRYDRQTPAAGIGAMDATARTSTTATATSTTSASPACAGQQIVIDIESGGARAVQRAWIDQGTQRLRGVGERANLLEPLRIESLIFLRTIRILYNGSP